MKPLAWALLAAAAAGDHEAAIEYFARARDVTIAAPERQNYVVVDTAIWSRSRAGLEDLRLYDGDTQVPYALVTVRGGTASEELDVKILNAATRGDHTEFDLDLTHAPEYNRITLTLDRKDFLATATVEGRDSLRGPPAARWPTPSTLFDFSREHLGANATIAIPTWSFRYVHVRLSPGIRPAQVKKAAVSHLLDSRAAWTDVGVCRLRAESPPGHSVVECLIPPNVPLDRVLFDIPPTLVNFRRTVRMTDMKGALWVGGASISRIRMDRGGTTVVSENLAVGAVSAHPERFDITIDNGDDPPLEFTAVRPQALERRIYFHPRGKTALKLYYGDEKLVAPTYDYAKFFREDTAAARAQLGPDAANFEFAGRADDRPWSERHKAVLWVAMILAVAGLGAMALRGLQSGAAPKR